ncbi:MAG: hypothetical protein KBT36_16850 [Kurthia sp.]|nr:hypothetical protein [Candidatus Kurthia equi]
MTEKYPLTLLAQAIYSVNKHAKTALDNRFLYSLKKNALEKLISQKRAKKIGLHFVNNPRLSQQQSSVLISCADYYFHTLPEKNDFKLLPHLGHLDDSYRNPIRRMSLNRAKEILIDFVGQEPSQKKEYVKVKSQPAAKKSTPYLHSSSYFYGH